MLAGIAGFPGVTVVSNPSNLGYTRTVNKGCDLAGRNDVILLNSDTVVGPNWLRNLKIAAHRDARIGTVTAVSDNAGAFSVPRPGHNPMTEGVAVDVLAPAAIAAPPTLAAPVDVPTGKRFCLSATTGRLAATALVADRQF